MFGFMFMFYDVYPEFKFEIINFGYPFILFQQNNAKKNYFQF